MKKIIMLLALGMCSGNIVAGGIMTKEVLLETMETTFEKSVCKKNYNTCIGVKKSTCLTEAKTILRKECSDDVPEELEDIDEVRTYAGSIGKCLGVKYVEKHNAELMNNIKTPACQAMVKGK